MKTYPLVSLTLDEAIELQFKLVDHITQEFDGYEILTNGDMGVHPSGNQPQTTRKVERVLASFFEVEDACFVRGAGTGAIREGLMSFMNPNSTLLVHEAPIYSTTITSLNHLGIKTISCDFNNLNDLKMTLTSKQEISGVLIQYTRQSIQDSYDISEVIRTIKEVKDIPIITDDNYAIMKVRKSGAQLGADLSCFSLFKLLGPQGLGIVVGKKDLVDRIRSFHYSGGSQVQGFEALDAMRSIVYAPVALAVQAQEIEKICVRLNDGEIKGVKSAVIANAQSKVILVEFNQPIAREVLSVAHGLGAAAYPVGAESRYEVSPMFYRVSGTMLASSGDMQEYWIRINPMRSGTDTVLRILEASIEAVI